jgi:hypothetical protein
MVNAYLTVIDGPDRGKQVKVGEHVRVGRDASLELEISDGDTGVHRSPHFSIYFGEGLYHFTSDYEGDTRINGRVAQRAQMRNGDIIEIGYFTRIRFWIDESGRDLENTSPPDTPTRF